LRHGNGSEFRASHYILGCKFHSYYRKKLESNLSKTPLLCQRLLIKKTNHRSCHPKLIFIICCKLLEYNDINTSLEFDTVAQGSYFNKATVGNGLSAKFFPVALYSVSVFN